MRALTVCGIVKRMRRLPALLLGLASGLSLVAGCDDSCSDELLLALELHITVAEGVTVNKVTAEREHEEACDFTRNPAGGDELIYGCHEQGAGTADYKVRVYSNDRVIYEDSVEVPGDSCHVKDQVIVYIDLTE